MGKRRPMSLRKQTQTFDPEALQKELRREQTRFQTREPEETAEPAAPLPHQIQAGRRSRVVIGRALLKGANLLPDLMEYYQSRPGVKYKPLTPVLVYASQEFLSHTLDGRDYEDHLHDRLPDILRNSSVSTDALESPMTAEVQYARIRSAAGGRLALTFAVAPLADTELSPNYFSEERDSIRRSIAGSRTLENVHRRLGLSMGTIYLNGSGRRELPGSSFSPSIRLPREVELGPVEILLLQNPT